ncbi:unnamed protein product [Tilletia caries]|nr:unnamed protein product [Tilletia caries]
MSDNHTLPKLDYPYNALEPAISEQIMTLHHQKHHQTYVNNLNAAEKAYAQAVFSTDVKKQIELQSAIKFNGGGHTYYLQYQNVKVEYFKNIWSVINYKEAEARFQAASSKASL